MNRFIRWLLKVYIKLAWLKLYFYYEKLTSIAYAGVIAISPFKKFQALETLWAQLSRRTSDGYLNECKHKLRGLWETHYKDREIEETSVIMGTPRFSDSVMLRLQWATAAQSQSSFIADEIPDSQQSRRRRRPGPGRRRRPVPPAVSQPLDELDRYFSETLVDQDLYQGNPVIWWKDVGARRFPRLSLLAANLLFIPASTASVERLFNHVGAIISPRKSCLNRYIIAQAQSLSNWQKNGIYQATKDWEQALPIIEIE
jgi:hypothetical protein